MDREAVDEDGMSFLRGSLAEAFEEHKDARGLRVMQPGVVAAHDIVQEYVDVGRLVRVEGSDEGIRVRDKISLRRDQLENEADLNDLSL